MSKGLFFNMAAGAVLATGLGILGLNIVSQGLFHTDTDAVGLAVEVAEEGASGGPAVAELKPDWGTIFADPAQLATYVAEGEKQHKVCMSCHNFDAGGPNGTGPNLHDVFGRASGSHPGFTYSEGMRALGQTWSYDELDGFLTAPGKYVTGTAMSFQGLKKQEDRIAVIAYLRSLAGNHPLPAPDPSRNPATAAAAAAPAAGAADAAAPAAAAPAAAAPAAGAADAAAPAAAAPAAAAPATAAPAAPTAAPKQ